MKTVYTKLVLAGATFSAMLASGATLAQTPPASCYGRSATHHITDLSQLQRVSSNIYALYGTTGNDTVVINITTLPPGATGIEVHFVKSVPAHDSLPPFAGGSDYICASGSPYHLTVRGGRYVNGRGVDWVNAQLLSDFSIVDIDSAGYINTGNGNNLVQIDASTSHSSTTVIGGSGDDSIAITTQINAKVISKGGDDLINIELRNNPGGADVPAAVDAGDGDDVVAITAESSKGRAFIVGGDGADDIVTFDGADLIFGSEVSYSGESLENVNVNSFDNAATAFSRASASELRTLIDALHEDDIAGGTISSGGGYDYVFGTDGNDIIYLNGGNDYAHAYGGRDRVWGGTGSDRIYGDDGTDDVYGESGGDHLYGGSGNDLIEAGSGNDDLHGDSGNDKLYGNDGDDSINGGSGSDTCSGGPGDDTLSGC